MKASVARFVVTFTGLVFLAPTTLRADSETLVTQYEQQERKAIGWTQSDRARLYREWQPKFLAAVDASGDSPVDEAILRNALVLSTAVADYPSSVRLCDKLIQQSEVPLDKLRWRRERLEIRERIAIGPGFRVSMGAVQREAEQLAAELEPFMNNQRAGIDYFVASQILTNASMKTHDGAGILRGSEALLMAHQTPAVRNLFPTLGAEWRAGVLQNMLRGALMLEETASQTAAEKVLGMGLDRRRVWQALQGFLPEVSEVRLRRFGEWYFHNAGTEVDEFDEAVSYGRLLVCVNDPKAAIAILRPLLDQTLPNADRAEDMSVFELVRAKELVDWTARAYSRLHDRKAVAEVRSRLPNAP